MNIRTAYLALAIAGAVIPYAFFMQHLNDAGFSFAQFLRSVFANPAAGGFAADLIISSVVFWVVIFRQRVRHSGPPPLPFVLLNLLVGLSCALPAWLYASSSRKNEGVSS